MILQVGNRVVTIYWHVAKNDTSIEWVDTLDHACLHGRSLEDNHILVHTNQTMSYHYSTGSNSKSISRQEKQRKEDEKQS